MGFFGDMIAKAQPSEQTPILEPGHYTVEIALCKMIVSQKDNKQYFIAEYTVIESDNRNCPPGHYANWPCCLNNAYGPADVKRFLAAVGNCSHEEITPEESDAVISAANPLGTAKARVHVKVTEIMTKDSPTKPSHPFAKHTWSAIRAETAY